MHASLASCMVKIFEIIFLSQQSYVLVEYRRKLPVNGRDQRSNRCRSCELALRGVAREGPCPPAPALTSSLDTGDEFLALSRWVEERENHRGSSER